jgi:arabinose-5-phosphate isomerase
LSKNKILSDAREVIRLESRAIADLSKRIDGSFSHAVELLYKCKGRVIVTGIGKSGIIARKIVATLNSTGTPAVWLHSADSIHGDLGIIKQGDIIVCISKSGDSVEVINLLKVIKNFDIKVISIVGDPDSDIREFSDVVIDASVKSEACPHNLAPTSSTTAALVLGDAIAVSLLKKKEFSKEKFAMLHPGGILGKRLNLKVSDLMIKGKDVPIVQQTTPFTDVIIEISSKRLGCACVVNKSGRLIGIITDGDIRRLLHKHSDISGLEAGDAMNTMPKTVPENMLCETAIQMMEKFSITQLVVTAKKRIPIGVIHLHDLVKAGLG